MASGAKTLQAMSQNPKGDWNISDIENVCREYGLICRHPAKGSHYIVKGLATGLRLTIPSRRPIKPCYLKDFVKLVEAFKKGDHHAHKSTLSGSFAASER